MTENRERELEIVMRVIQAWTADSTCQTCKTVHDRAKEALKVELEERHRPYEPGLD